MKSILWAIPGILAGGCASFLLVIGVEFFSAVVHPFPPGFQHTPEEMCAHVANYPNWILGVVVPMWGLTTLIGVWIAGRLGNLYAAWIVGLFLLAMVGLNLSMLPYPSWFKISNLVVVPFAIAAGAGLIMSRQSASIEVPSTTT